MMQLHILKSCTSDVKRRGKKGRAEMDFVLSYKDGILPIKVKYKNIKKFSVSKSFHSFVEAYQPKTALIITSNFKKESMLNNTLVKMIPLSSISLLFQAIDDFLKEIYQSPFKMRKISANSLKVC